MHPARPQEPAVPCPVCGASVDPLRARQVILLEDGFRFLCNAQCRDRFYRGERIQEGPARRTPRSSARVTPPSGWPQARQPRPEGDQGAAESTPDAAPEEPGLEGWQWAGIGTVGTALAFGVIPGPLVLAILSALLTCAAAGVILYASRPVYRDLGFFPSVLAPGGTIVAAVSALWARVQDPQAWGLLAGAAVAAGAVLARVWIDREADRPVQRAIDTLRAPLPKTVQVPVEDADNPLEVGVEPVPVEGVRAGEQVLAFEGEVVAVDGVVQAGEADALLHPGARTPTRRTQGDPLLAGARIVDGAVRLLVTRVGEDRGLLRPAGFGRAAGPTREPASIGRLAARLVQWGGVAALLGAAGGLALVEAEGLSGQLSAAAAVLVAAPLLSIRRSAEAPWVAAGTAAAERGIVYASGHAMDAAGRVTVAALCTHGTVSEGAPEVVEVHVVDEDTDPNHILALAAGAELAAEDHSIARALRRYAESRGIQPASVRRPTAVPGRGVTALGPDGEEFLLGNRQLLIDEGVSVAVADAEAVRAEERGHTVLFAAVSGRVRAIVALQDNVRLGARAAVQRLFDLHVEVVLVSGDHRTSVETLAGNLDVAHVRAELVPDERAAEIARLREHGGPVAVVGHDGRDGAALSGADVPVVLGGAGAPAGERGIGLATSDLRDAAASLFIARAARTEAWRTTLAAVAVGTVLVAGAAVGWLGPGLAATLAVGLDAWALPAPSRLLRRIALRVPAGA